MGRTWTDEDLIEAVKRSKSLAQVMRTIGLKPTRYDVVRRDIARLGLSIDHLDVAPRVASRRGKWTSADLTEIVASSSSYAEVMRRLGYQPSGGVHRWLKGHIRSLGLSTDHFKGRAWARGLKNTVPDRARPLEEVLRRGVSISSGYLRRRLIAEGVLESRCSECGLQEWRGEVLPLMLDHINGDPMDNRLANLRILCPNCHALTPTWCARNRKPA